MSKFESINNFVKAINGEFNGSYKGLDGESFRDNKFFVVDTCICRVVNDILYVSANSITPKCSLFIRDIVMKANELHGKTLIYVPQWHSCDSRSHQFSKEDIINAFQIVVDKMKGKKDIYNQQHLQEIKSILNTINEKCFTVPINLINVVNTTLAKMEDATKIENEGVKEYIKYHDYYEIVQAAYFNTSHSIIFKTSLKKYLNPSGEYAFLSYNSTDDKWYSSETIYGKPKVTMTGDEGVALADAYLEGSLKHGMKFGNYVIMKVMDNYVQISCNKYSRTMLKAARDFLVNLRSNKL